MNKWIPISNNTFPMNEWLLVTGWDGGDVGATRHYMNGMAVKGRARQLCWWPIEGGGLSYLTHWQPLPELPSTCADWLPIDIAPKDGSSLVLIVGRMAYLLDDDRPVAYEDEVPGVYVGLYHPEYNLWAHGIDDGPIFCDVTHWMPLEKCPD